MSAGGEGREQAFGFCVGDASWLRCQLRKQPTRGGYIEGAHSVTAYT